MRTLRFSQKILLMPLLCGLSLLALVVTLNMYGSSTDLMLTRIEENYVPAAELGAVLEHKLGAIHRSLEDATAAMDADLLLESDTKLKDMFATLAKARSAGVIRRDQQTSMEANLNEYYDAARDATSTMIYNQRSEIPRKKVERMQRAYLQIKNSLKVFRQQNEQEMQNAIHNTQKAHAHSTRLATGILLFSLSILAFLSWVIRDSLTNQIQRAAGMANFIADGREIQQTGEIPKDELGELLKVMQHMATKVQLRTLELQREVQERTRAQQQLEMARDEAENANRAKSEFLANMSHEIRTPINGIIGMIELALATNPSREQKEFLKLAKLSADSLVSVINDILDFSKIEAKKLILEKLEFNLEEELFHVAALLAPSAFEKGLELICSINEDVPPVLIGDSARLRQILTNLIGNAIKFTNHGEVILSVECARSDSPLDTVNLLFVVQDTGIGIREDVQQAIFDPFIQADGSITREHGGTGLGLAISSELAELMNGKLWVTSKLDKGSSFQLQIPFEFSNSQQDRRNKRVEKLEGMRVLIVDHRETNRNLLRRMLNRWNMKVSVTDDPALALIDVERQRLAGEPYGIILIDPRLSGVDGFTLANKIQSKAEHGPAVILMISPIDLQCWAEEHKRAASIFLTKPLKKSDVLAALLKALSPPENDEKETVPEPSGSVDPMEVLLAEDNLINQKLTETILKKHGHNVTTASNGKEAVSAFVSGEFDLILMDIQMPGMGGFEATAAIRALEQGDSRRIPIIALTAHALKGDKEKCLQAGMDDYLSKPVHEADLLRVLSAWHSLRHRENQSPVQLTLPEFAEDPAFFAEMVEALELNAPLLLKRVQDAIDSGDAETVRAAAHTVKGSFSNFGKNQATQTALELEKAAERGDFAIMTTLGAKLAQDVDRLVNYLRGHVAQPTLTG